MQAYLARSERLDEKQTVQELENFLDHVVFEGDALLAEDLMKYLTSSGTDQVRISVSLSCVIER